MSKSAGGLRSIARGIWAVTTPRATSSGRCQTGCWPATFEAHGVLAELDFAAMKETRIEGLFAAWLELPEDQRNEDGCRTSARFTR